MGVRAHRACGIQGEDSWQWSGISLSCFKPRDALGRVCHLWIFSVLPSETQGRACPDERVAGCWVLPALLVAARMCLPPARLSPAGSSSRPSTPSSDLRGRLSPQLAEALAAVEDATDDLLPDLSEQ